MGKAMGHLKPLLLPLQETITNTRPFVSGTFQLPATHLSLFYKTAREDHAARHVNFTNATSGELEQLAQACQPATFNRNDEAMMDETYHKTAKMDPDLFSTPLGYGHTDIAKIVSDCLLHGYDAERELTVGLHELNFYGKGSFSKPHVDIPCSKEMFGSLVLVFPTPHEGGALLIRHHGKEWTIDSAAELSTAPPSSIGYAAFFSDVEHEVAPVVSGHRITLTYKLHYDDDGYASEPPPPLQSASERSICAAFEALLENPKFLPRGGVLGFGLQHVYQIKDDLYRVHGLLKGSDAALYRAVRSLGFKPALYLYYESDEDAGLIDRVLDFGGINLRNPVKLIRSLKGITVRYGGDDVTAVEWVTPVTKFNCLSSPYLAYGNEPILGLAYGHLCLIVHMGKMGKRMRYPVAAQLKKQSKDAQEWSTD